jgi:hypothetical protein
MFELAGRLKASAKLIKAKKEVIKQIQAERKNDDADLNYLDKKYLTDGEAAAEISESSGVSNQNLEVKREIKMKRESWREIIRVKGLETYKRILKRQVEAMRRVRQMQLIEKFPLATFKDLAGFTWYSPNLQFIEGISAVAI